MKKAAHSSLASEFPKMVLDPSAETAAELIKQWHGCERALFRFIRTQVEAGAWEKVYKRVGNRNVPAYRRAK